MSVIPDWKLVLLQAIPFLVTVVALHHIIFKPMLAYLEARTRAIEGGREEGRRLQEQVAERLAVYEEKLAEARAQVSELRSRKRAEALAEYDRRLAAARAAAETRVNDALAEISEACEAARLQLRRSANELADRIAGQVLGRRDLAAR